MRKRPEQQHIKRAKELLLEILTTNPMNLTEVIEALEERDHSVFPNKHPSATRRVVEQAVSRLNEDHIDTKGFKVIRSVHGPMGGYFLDIHGEMVNFLEPYEFMNKEMKAIRREIDECLERTFDRFIKKVKTLKLKSVDAG